MKKSLIFGLIFISQVFFAQANRFIYQVTMKPDANNKAEVKSELAYLDVSSDKSIFYGEKRMLRDSIFGRARQTGNFKFDRSQMENLRSDIDFIVEKDYKAGTKTFKSRIARDQYSYEEERPMEWKILPETLKIDEYKTQKAETVFAGRTWYAWFTTDIPFQDGPYKFSGLPGLIVKVEDAAGDYSFDLKESKKIAEPANFESRGNMVKVKRTVFEQQMDKFRKDPTSFVAPPQPGRNDNGGGFRREMSPEQRKEMANRVKEDLKKNNNPIELK